MSSSSSAEETFPIIGADDLVKLKGPNGEDVYGVITATGWDSEEEEGQDDDEQLGDDELRELLAQYGINDMSQIDDLTEEEGEGDNKQRVLRLNQDTKDKLAKAGGAPTAGATGGAPKGTFGAGPFGAGADDDDDDEDDDGEGGEDDLGGVDEDFGQRPKLGANEVVVQILGGGDIILPANQVTLVDKSLCPGDVVLSRRDPTSQSGVVQSVKTFLDIYVPSKNQVLHAVPSRLVKFLHGAPFLYVVEKQKIGRVEEYVDRARIRFSNGMECWVVLTSLQGEELEISDVASAYLMNPETDFIPGHQVTVSLDTLKNAEWIGSSRFTAKQFNTHSRRTGVIKEIQLEGAVVEWIFSNNEEEPIDDEEDPEGPPIVDMKKVFKLTHYDNTKWLVGNRVYLKAGAFSRGGERHKKDGEVRPELYDDINDVAPVSSKPPRSAAAGGSSKPARGGRGGRGKAAAPRGGTTIASKPAPSDDDIIFGSVIRTTSFVEVKWQDNTVTDNIRTTDLLDHNTVIDTDFWPEDFVQPIDKDNYHIKSKFPEGAEIAGIVRKCDSINRQVLVDWFAVGSDPQKDLHIQELVSAYEVVQKENFNFNLSSIVRKVSEDDSAMDEYPDWVGEVIALDRGHISVRWADGSKTTVLPHQISLLDLDGEEDGPEDDEDFDGEITPIGEQFESGTIEEIDEGNTATGGVKIEDADFDEKKKGDSDSKAKVAALEQEEAEQLKEITKSLSELKIEEVKAVEFAYGKFPRIQVVDNTPSNFKFIEDSAHRPFELAQKIQKDLQKLTADMPERTFIHLFQDNLFNLQILIIGTDGTPFFDVPFVFDIQAGPEFFSEGPRINFRTDALGPILPVIGLDGAICIDQLISEVEDDEDDPDAKKDGDDDEKKEALYGEAEPSLYDLVIYIQGIMLGTSTPYTLEPSVERFNGSSLGKVNGALYNEVSVVHSLEHVIRTVAKNDTSFADVIKAHLAERIPKIIERVQAFIKWHEEVVKPNPDSLKSTTVFTENPLGIPLRATAGFVQSLTALLPRLEAAAASAAAAPASE